jgi:hypothetical protein
MMTTMIAAILIAQAAAAPASQPTGIPACDKFVQMVNACIRTKVPPAARADEQQRIDAFRSAMGFVPASLLADQCAENIKTEIRRDRYGCYAGQAASAGVPAPCSLIAAADLQAIVGSAYGQGQPGSSKCSFAPADGSPRPVTLEVRWSGGREELANARAMAPPPGASRAEVRQAVVVGRTVEGLGDDAFLLRAGFTPMLHVRKGEVAVIVNAPLSDEQLSAIARKALERMGR